MTREYAGILTFEEYNYVKERVPIPHVDLVFLRRNQEGAWEVLIFDRKIEPFGGSASLTGGRQLKNETLLQTIARQAAEVGLRARIIPPFGSEFPAYVDSKLDQAPGEKQATTAVFPVTVAGEVRGLESTEVSNPRWIPVGSLPENIISHHKRKISEVIKKLDGISR